MKDLAARMLACATLGAIAGVAATTSGHAQEPFAAWQDPTRQITLQVTQNGWQVAGPHVPEMGFDLRAVPDSSERPQSGSCTVQHPASLGAPWTSRENANQYVRDVVAPLWERSYAANRDYTVELFELAELDSVVVLNVYYGLGPLRGLSRTLVLQNNGKAVVYTIDCHAERSDISRVATAINIAESLRIHERP